VPGGTEDVGAEEGAIVEGAVKVDVGPAVQTLGEGPLRAGVVLGLDGCEPLDDVLRALEAGAEEMLGVEALVGDVHRLTEGTRFQRQMSPRVRGVEGVAFSVAERCADIRGR
jgi:hypothetical protein